MLPTTLRGLPLLRRLALLLYNTLFLFHEVYCCTRTRSDLFVNEELTAMGLKNVEEKIFKARTTDDYLSSIE